MTSLMFTTRSVAVSACALMLCVPYVADAQDLSRYRDITFGSSVSAVSSMTGTNAGAVTVVHRRPALIQELTWRPQYSVNRPFEQGEAAKEIVFRFHDDTLFRITVVYDARLVAGLTNGDIIDAVSAVYGPATRTPAAAKGAALADSGSISSSTALARWQSADYEFTLMREVYPATYRLIGVSRQVEAAARATEAEAARLDKEEAPRREAERAAAEADRKRAAEEKTRTTNKGEFRP